MRRLIAAVCVVAGIAAVICICRHGERPVPTRAAHRTPTREIASFKSAANVRQDVQSGPLEDAAHVPLHIASVPAEAGEKLFADIGNVESEEERGEAASEKNQLMDALLNQPTIPADYGATMIALFDAADETSTIVAAAAFRALAEMSEFDRGIDTLRLDARLVSSVGDKSSAPAVRVMAAQLCGERKIAGAKIALQRIVSDAHDSETLKRAASWALKTL